MIEQDVLLVFNIKNYFEGFSMEKMKIGIIGCGSITQFAHLPAIQKSDLIDLIALCDLDESLLKDISQKYKIPKTYVDFKNFLKNKDIEAIIIAVPDAHHIPIAKECLKAKKHILIEKPISISSYEAEELLPFDNDKNCIIQIGNMKRSDPGIQFAKQFIKKKIGNVFSISGWYCDTNLRSTIQKMLLPTLEKGKGIKNYSSLKFNNKEDYSFLTHGIHLINTMQYLGGNIIEIIGSRTYSSGEYCWHGLLKYASGAIGNIELVVKINANWNEGFKVHGENGTVYGKTFLHFYKLPSEVRAYDFRNGLIEMPNNIDGDLFRRQLESFVTTIREQTTPICTLKEAIQDLRVLEALKKSITTKSWENIKI